MTEKPWKNRIHAAIRHPKDPAILVISDSGSWKLPRMDGENIWIASTGKITPYFREILNAELWALRQFYYFRDSDARETENILAFELLDPSWMPPTDSQWVDLAAFSKLDFKYKHLVPCIAGYLEAFADDSVPVERPPWAQPGWLPYARQWIEESLEKLSVRVLNIEPVKQWGISCVLKVETDSGDFFFKTTNRQMPLFINESSITTFMADLFPGSIPKPTAINPEEDWMLLPGFDETFSDDTPVAILIDLFRNFANLQIKSIPMQDALFTAGALDRRLPVLREQVKEMLADPESTAMLAESDRSEIRSMLPLFLEIIDRLEARSIPYTFLHGDLHPGNAAFYKGRLIYFDLTDISIAHPFFDLMMVSWMEPDETEQVLAAYFEPWISFLGEMDLAEIFQLVKTPLNLHHAVSYYQIVRHLEQDAKIELNFTHEFLLEARKSALEFLEKNPQIGLTSNGKMAN